MNTTNAQHNDTIASRDDRTHDATCTHDTLIFFTIDDDIDVFFKCQKCAMMHVVQFCDYTSTSTIRDDVQQTIARMTLTRDTRTFTQYVSSIRKHRFETTNVDDEMITLREIATIDDRTHDVQIMIDDVNAIIEQFKIDKNLRTFANDLSQICDAINDTIDDDI